MTDRYAIYLLGCCGVPLSEVKAEDAKSLLAFRLGTLEADKPEDRASVETAIAVLNSTVREATASGIEAYLRANSMPGNSASMGDRVRWLESAILTLASSGD